ncbi:MAG: hypothetical protein ACFB15_29055 [Cyclobacteriaceae bacterium]
MLKQDQFEQGVRRVGAEQEMVFVDKAFRPALIGPQIKASLDKKYITTEYVRFNLEVNLSPISFQSDCLSKLKSELIEKIAEVEQQAKKHKAEIPLTGILPTIRKSDTAPEVMTQEPRYLMRTATTTILFIP